MQIYIILIVGRLQLLKIFRLKPLRTILSFYNSSVDDGILHINPKILFQQNNLQWLLSLIRIVHQL
jgi:hypothetical protein